MKVVTSQTSHNSQSCYGIYSNVERVKVAFLGFNDVNDDRKACSVKHIHKVNPSFCTIQSQKYKRFSVPSLIEDPLCQVLVSCHLDVDAFLQEKAIKIVFTLISVSLFWWAQSNLLDNKGQSKRVCEYQLTKHHKC